MTVWIFSNCRFGYGREICESAVKYCRNKDIPFRVIFPPILEKHERLHRGPRAMLREFLYRRVSVAFLPYPCEVVENVNDQGFIAQIGEGDVALVAGFSQIFRSALLSRFRQAWNVHPSLLPLYRGPVPSRWCIENHELRTGYTVHRMTTKIDEGEILLQEVVEIREGMDERALDVAISVRASQRVPQIVSALTEGSRPDGGCVDARSVYRVHQAYAGFDCSRDVLN